MTAKDDPIISCSHLVPEMSILACCGKKNPKMKVNDKCLASLQVNESSYWFGFMCSCGKIPVTLHMKDSSSQGLRFGLSYIIHHIFSCFSVILSTILFLRWGRWKVKWIGSIINDFLRQNRCMSGWDENCLVHGISFLNLGIRISL